MDETPFWERIEGDGRPDAQDAQHWVRVYQELLRTLRGVDAVALEGGARIPRLITTIEDRLQFWTVALHDSPVGDARRRQQRERRRDTA